MLDSLYLKMPRFIQNMGVSFKGYLNSRVRFSKKYDEFFKFLERFEELPFERKAEYQLKELNRLIDHSVRNSTFYKDFYRNIKYPLEKLEDINTLPILEKDLLIENLEDIYISNEVPSFTGGTTGASMKVYFTSHDMQKRMATLDYFKYKTSGFKNNKMWRASFTGKHIISLKNKKTRHPFRINIPAKQLLFSSFHITEENIPFYIKALNKYQPQSIDGFFSSILDIAEYMNRNNIKLDFTPLGIYPTSETVTDVGKEEIEKAFGCKVFNQYASSEGAPFITECRNGVLHIDQSSGIFEVEDSGDILVTSFTSYGTPLIRYRIGDSVRNKSVYKCECGVESQIVEEILGRTSNYIVNTYGQKITEARVANLFKEFSQPIVKGKIIQHSELDFLIKLVTVGEANLDEIHSKCKQTLGDNAVIIVEVVDDISLDSSGKYRILERCIDG